MPFTKKKKSYKEVHVCINESIILYESFVKLRGALAYENIFCQLTRVWMGY